MHLRSTCQGFFGLGMILLVNNLLSGCSTFAMSYQNYFTKNFAYVASNYDGNPNLQLSDGAESNNIEDGNLEAYPASEYPTVYFGFRTLEHHNSQYTKGNNMDETITGFLVAPGKTEEQAIPFANLTMKGSNIEVKPAIAQIKGTTFIKMTYPAFFMKVDNKALQAAHGSGSYTLIWKSVLSNGKVENRELSRVVTKFIP